MTPFEEARDSSNRRRLCVDHVVSKLGVSERMACRVLGQHRSTQRKKPTGRADEEALDSDISGSSASAAKTDIAGSPLC
ncbi:hypothetical protein FP2506_15989 [Fulvimarina pelagi HTCC2506]|uniref:Uncharacterized protein n=1 Tax=Fulvimarina pelagi HTCC2506 TaxID=314231 RepID=Q0G382_9HYPH|nr:hypothetical protein FP2506_15989 [Fulvimarina pelagi HTCC2506]